MFDDSWRVAKTDVLAVAYRRSDDYAVSRLDKKFFWKVKYFLFNRIDAAKWVH